MPEGFGSYSSGAKSSGKGPDGFGSIDDAEQWIADWQKRATDNAHKFQAMQAEIEQISVTETSANGSVRVTVGSNGLIEDVFFAEHARNRTMTQLAGEFMRTLRKAQSRIPELMQQAMADTVGSDDPVAQQAFQQARATFPEDPDEAAAPAPPAPNPDDSQAVSLDPEETGSGWPIPPSNR